MTDVERRRQLPILAVISSITLCCLGICAYNAHSSGSALHSATRIEKLRLTREVADDLIRKGTLIGKTREEVLSFLGQPAEHSAYASDSRMVYCIEDKGWIITIDQKYFVIEFGDDGTVASCQIMRC